MSSSPDSRESWRSFLLELGRAVRTRLVRALRDESGGLAEPIAEEGGDVIYRLDRCAEEAMLAFLGASRPLAPFLLVAEGVHHGRLLVGDAAPRFRVLCDPVDGSRGLMYDKRPGFFLAAVAEERGDNETRLSEAFASVIIELPTSKQGWSDEFSALPGAGVQAHRVNLASGDARPINPRPSRAATLREGFGHVVSFFPGTKVLAAELLERISLAVVGPVEAGRANVFDDQYICSSGQMVELMMGRDRFCCDLRPLMDEVRRRRGEHVATGLACHPYDIAGGLVVKQAGVILTDGLGRPLDAKFNVSDGVHWCGFANPALHDAIMPVIRRWLDEHGVL
jgi:hypothetical protein